LTVFLSTKPNVVILNNQQIRCLIVSIFQPDCCLDWCRPFCQLWLYHLLQLGCNFWPLHLSPPALPLAHSISAVDKLPQFILRLFCLFYLINTQIICRYFIEVDSGFFFFFYLLGRLEIITFVLHGQLPLTCLLARFLCLLPLRVLDLKNLKVRTTQRGNCGNFSEAN